MRMPGQTEDSYVALVAVVSAGAMIAFQVAAKATRDALFLSNFPVTALPAILIASAVFSILAVFSASRLMSMRGPGVVIPFAFGISSVFLSVEWLVFLANPATAAILLYLHVAAFGAILVSGFWSMIAELFDPRTARARIGRIAAGGTFGGIIGGLVAERAGAVFSVGVMLPVLALLHLICATLNYVVGRETSFVRPNPDDSRSPIRSGFQILREVPYLKQLAVLVLLGTIAETLLDFVLKTQASSSFSQSQDLIRFFALFYTGVSLLTFLAQAAFSRFSLQRFGITGTMSTMPLAVALGGMASLLSPGLVSIGFARGSQSVLRSSLFRSGYELLYAPVPHEEKRAAKTIVDVGFDRLGDAFGGGMIRIVLSFGFTVALNNRLFIVTGVALGVLSLILTRHLRKGYIATLERSLVSRAASLDLNVNERTTRETMLRTLGTVELGALRTPQEVVPAATRPAPHSEGDVSLKVFADLQAEDANVVRDALGRQTTLNSFQVAPVIRLLARDDVSEDAVKALGKVAPAIVGQLTDALLNKDEHFAVRRRVPRVLVHAPSPRTIEGLLHGLTDSRFEVRFSCARALSRICADHENLSPQAQSVYEAIRTEIQIATRLAETPKVLDHYDNLADASAEQLWSSTDIRLEHIFRLLSVCLPREPLHIAFRALHTDDAQLRGTALEYLDSTLPPGIREELWQFLEGPYRPDRIPRPPDHVLEDLMQSRHRVL